MRLSGLSSALLLAGCAPAPKPNILLITMDTTRADAVGAYGSTTGATPNVDRLASEGARFDRAYTVTPLTIPSHSSIHTGLYPPRHGVRDNGDFYLSDDATTLAERLKGAGYATMASVGAEVTSHHWGFAQGFDAFFDDMGPVDPQGNRWRVERRGDKVVADAVGWLDAHGGGDTPWFAWVHLFDAHSPYEPPAPYDTRFPGRPYAGEVAFVDEQVGALRKWLEDHGQLERTWIVALADHGEGLGSHGEAMHGVLLYDATTHIPLVIRPPGGGARVVDTPVSTVDLAPTLLAAAGLEVPAGLDGVNLLPVLNGDAQGDATRAVFAESLYAWHHYGWAPQSALVTNDRKLIHSTTPELYARGDAQERDDLSATDPDALNALQGRLEGMVGAMAPSGGAARADQSAERVAQLEALGYLTTSSGEGPTDNLPDPVKQLPVLSKLERARAAFRDNDLPAARVAIDEALAADPALVETRSLLANVLWRQGDRPGAMKVLQALDAEHPSSQTKAMMGTITLENGDAPGAVALLSEAVTMDPYQAGPWVSYLHALFLARDPRLASEAERARKMFPDSAVAIGMSGVALAQIPAQGDRAELLLKDALARDPNQPFVNHALGMVYRDRGDTLRAEPLFEEEIRLFPPALPSRRMLVEIYAAQKRYDEQLAQLQEIRARESTPETLHSLAQVLFNLKRYPEAAEVVDECRADAPSYPGCAMLEANVLKKLGKEAEAQAAYRRALALAGQSPPEAAPAGERPVPEVAPP